MHSRKTLFFHDTELVKNAGSFNKPIGCYDGTEIYEFAGSFILNKLESTTIKSNI